MRGDCGRCKKEADLRLLGPELQEIAGYTHVCGKCHADGSDLWVDAWQRASSIAHNLADRAIADYFDGEDHKEVRKKATIFHLTTKG